MNIIELLEMVHIYYSDVLIAGTMMGKIFMPVLEMSIYALKSANHYAHQCTFLNLRHLKLKY